MNIILKTLAVALAVVVSGAWSAANAATYNYNSYITGLDLGSQTTAVLEATQNGNDVDFALTNTLTGQPSGAFIRNIGFTYGGTLPTSVVALPGTQAGGTAFSTAGLSGGGISIDFGVGFDNSNSPASDRLVVGDTALFRVADVQLSLFDFGSLKTAIHLQGLAGGESSKYTTGDTPVIPLPAAGWMLLAGLGGLVAMRRRKQV